MRIAIVVSGYRNSTLLELHSGRPIRVGRTNQHHIACAATVLCTFRPVPVADTQVDRADRRTG